MKKALSLFLSIVLVLGIFLSVPFTESPFKITAEAATIENNGLNGIYIDINSAPYSTLATVPTWGQYAYGTQGCAWFATSRTKQLTGKNIQTIYSGYSWYYSTYQTFGFTRGSTLQAKALACYENHVSVVEQINGNTVTISEGGYTAGNSSTGYCVIRNMSVSQLMAGNEYTGKLLGFVYLGVSGGNWKETTPKTTVGTNFYGAIINTERNKALTVDSNDNVAIYSYSGTAKQVWYFQKLADGTYEITSCYNGEALDVVNGATSGWANVQTYPVNGSTAQKWGFYGSSPYLYISAECNAGVLDVADAKYEDGTNICINTKTGHNAQLFKVITANAPATPTLSVDTSNKTVKFSWNSTSSTNSYELKIYNGSSVYKTISNLTSTSYSVSLPAGAYSAIVTSKNAFASTPSNKVTFTVVGSNSSGEWVYANTLPSGVTSKNYYIEYKHTYEKVAKSSPGSGWTKGSVAKQVYENSGDVYYSNLPLQTSQTRVLVDYSYYHFCGGSKGNEVNYDLTQTFNHYDGISKNNVYEFYSHADFADSRYTFYGLKYKDSGNYVYCCSGTTCDGSFGSHGYRSYYWYKTYAYQDKVAVDYYNYTKQGDWTSAKDSTATSYTVRYKPIQLKPSTPTLSKAANANGGVTVTWKAVSGADSYRVYRKTSSSGWTCLNSKVKSTSYTDTTAKSGTTYYYTVRAENEAGLSGYNSTGVSVKYLVMPTVTIANAATGVKVSWNKISGASKYYVYRKASTEKDWTRLTTSATGTSYTDTKAKSGTTYYYTVKAVSGSVASASKSSSALKYLAQPKVSSLSNTNSGITVKWNKITGASGYYVYRKTSSGSWSLIYTAKSGSTVSYTDKSAKAGTTYYYTVRAYSGSVKSTYTSSSAIRRLTTPTLKSVSSAKSGITFKWNKVTGASGYYVYRKTGSGSWQKIATIKSGSTVSYLDKTAKKGTTYTYTVRAYYSSSISYFNTTGLKIKDKY